MVLALQFSPSTLVHLERICKYIWPCSTFHWDQTQFNRNSIPEWLLVGYHWGQRRCSSFGSKVDCCPPYLVSLQLYHFFICFYIFWRACGVIKGIISTAIDIFPNSELITKSTLKDYCGVLDSDKGLIRSYKDLFSLSGDIHWREFFRGMLSQ